MFYAFFIYSGMRGFGRLVIKRTVRCFIKFQGIRSVMQRFRMCRFKGREAEGQTVTRNEKWRRGNEEKMSMLNVGCRNDSDSFKRMR